MDRPLRMPGDHCMWCVEPANEPCRLGCRKPAMRGEDHEAFDASEVETVARVLERSGMSPKAARLWGEQAIAALNAHRSPQGEDHEAFEDATAAFADASGFHLYRQVREGLRAALPYLSSNDRRRP